MTKKIIFTGGGSMGHVSVNIALIPYFKERGYDIAYIGSKSGIEKEMVQENTDIPYYSISSGKLRRYFSWENFIDPFKVIKGIYDAWRILKRQRPQVVFSKGGFVSVPVGIAAKLLKIPIILHESDVTPGLANKINIKFANTIFTTFKQTENYLPSNKAEYVGAVIRQNLYDGHQQRGYQFTKLSPDKPILLVMGGSLGSSILNEVIRQNLDTLLNSYQVIHLTGKDLKDGTVTRPGYVQYEFVAEELNDILSITDIAISRAGANAIYELLALKIPMLLIPLGMNQSRGDQILNAQAFKEQGFALVLQEEQLNATQFNEMFNQFISEYQQIKENMENYQISYTAEQLGDKIVEIINAKK